MKKVQLVILLGAIAAISTITGAAEAQRVCIIDNSNRVVCGRPYNGNNGGNNGNWNNNDSNYNRRAEVERAIDNIYRDVLGREPDSNGLRDYSDRVMRASWSFDRVRQDLSRGNEARSAINRVYVEVLRRNADNAGMNTYLRELQNGRSLDWVRQQLASSEEARGRR